MITEEYLKDNFLTAYFIDQERKNIEIQTTTEDKKKVFTGGVQKSKRFHEFFSSLANRKKCFYLDLAKRVKVSEIDGLHLDERGHEKVGKIVASKVISIFK